METRPIRGYKKHTIVCNIKSKIESWIDSISKDDEELAKAIDDNYIVTGGAIASMLLGEQPNDYDVYFKDEEVARRVAEYYIAKLGIKSTEKVAQVEAVKEPGRVRIKIKSAGIATEDTDNEKYEYFESGGEINEFLKTSLKESKKKAKNYSPAMITDNAISLHGGIQIIIRFVGQPEDIHKNYDFVHATNWYTSKEGLVLNQSSLESLMARELRYVGSLYPICSLFRMRKFIKRGWSITAGEVLKIAWDVSELDLKNHEVLREQLIGVDQAYFWEILTCLQKNVDKPIDRTYLYEVINRVFDEHEFGETHEEE